MISSYLLCIVFLRKDRNYDSSKFKNISFRRKNNTGGLCTLEFPAYISHTVEWAQVYHILLIFTILYIVEPSVF